jgi:hypothetical protein
MLQTPGPWQNLLRRFHMATLPVACSPYKPARATNPFKDASVAEEYNRLVALCGLNDLADGAGLNVGRLLWQARRVCCFVATHPDLDWTGVPVDEAAMDLALLRKRPGLEDRRSPPRCGMTAVPPRLDPPHRCPAARPRPYPARLFCCAVL